MRKYGCLLALSALLVHAACSNDDGAGGTQNGDGDTSADSGPSAGGGGAPTGGGSTGGGGAPTGGGGTGGTGGSNDEGCGGFPELDPLPPLAGTNDGGTDAGLDAGPVGPTLPSPTGACPAFVEGRAKFTAAGLERNVQLWLDADAAAEKDGPLVFVWYGTGGNTLRTETYLGQCGIERIRAAGGIVAAPEHANAGSFPWIGDGAPEEGEIDFALMDEVVGCARESVGIDDRRIHSVGFSAGAVFNARVGFARSSYIASIALYSGGGPIATPVQDPDNLFAAMVLYGGPADFLVVNFEDLSISYRDALVAAGHFAPLCNHGSGHTVPLDAVPSVISFLFDHPYGAVPSPYQNGFPPGFPEYCVP